MTTEVDQAALGRALEKEGTDKPLTEKEQAALDAQLALDREVKGYEEFPYHGLTMYRLIEAPDRTFADERDAQVAVTQLRYQRNVSGGTSI